MSHQNSTLLTLRAFPPNSSRPSRPANVPPSPRWLTLMARFQLLQFDYDVPSLSPIYSPLSSYVPCNACMLLPVSWGAPFQTCRTDLPSQYLPDSNFLCIGASILARFMTSPDFSTSRNSPPSPFCPPLRKHPLSLPTLRRLLNVYLFIHSLTSPLTPFLMPTQMQNSPMSPRPACAIFPLYTLPFRSPRPPVHARLRSLFT